LPIREHHLSASELLNYIFLQEL
jgi:hypothetical protein